MSFFVATGKKANVIHTDRDCPQFGTANGVREVSDWLADELTPCMWCLGFRPEPESPGRPSKLNQEIRREILELREAGESYRSITEKLIEEYGFETLSPTTVWQAARTEGDDLRTDGGQVARCRECDAELGAGYLCDDCDTVEGWE